MYRVSQEEREIFWKTIVYIIVKKKKKRSLYKHGYYSQSFRRYSCLNVAHLLAFPFSDIRTIPSILHNPVSN